MARRNSLHQRPNTFAQTNLPISLFACGTAADHTFTLPQWPGFALPLTLVQQVFQS
uniref:Uncharacterized protein n=1 Tax=mine drainage metagenome TaxID=410659 RepID=E6PY46_9ZZZZ